MDKFIFQKEEYIAIGIGQVPQGIKTKIRTLTQKKGMCLGNSRDIAEKSGCNIVEGYMVTKFNDDREDECVGHAWNEYNGVHFDLTAPLTNEPNVEESHYFVKEIYTAKELYTYYDIIRNAMKFSFKTNVKETESAVRAYINSLGK